jgi:peptide/nickel transport system substrate-binding protein
MLGLGVAGAGGKEAWMRRAWLVVVGLLAAIVWIGAAEARTVTWARAEDAITLDPHVASGGPTRSLSHQIYEPLIIRDNQGKALPALAESWNLTSNPQIWEFKLRRGIVFHDETPFTADDVVFSLNRARQPASALRSLLASVDAIIKVDAYTVRVRTRVPDPLLPANLTHLFIMSKSWSERNRTTRVQNLKGEEEPYAARHANGTGPFVLVSREPEVRTVMRRNSNYWGKDQVPLEITELVYRPIKSDADRVAALLSGEVDFVQDVPVEDLQRLQKTQGIAVNVGPENRAIFLGMNVGDAELGSSSIKGRNPFADKRVRQAISMTINRQAIQRNVMHGQSIPTGLIASSLINGYTRQLDQIPPVDIPKAKALLADAGYPGGFSVTLDCPSDSFVNDERICQDLAAQLAQIGMTVNLVVQSEATLVPLIRKTPPEVDFYLMGRSTPTFDSEYLFSQLYHTRSDRFGHWNATRYSNPEVDRLTEAILQETDLNRRNQIIAQIWRIVQDDLVYVPLHIQTLAYAVKSDFDVPVDVENMPKLKYVKFKKS